MLPSPLPYDPLSLAQPSAAPLGISRPRSAGRSNVREGMGSRPRHVPGAGYRVCPGAYIRAPNREPRVHPRVETPALRNSTTLDDVSRRTPITRNAPAPSGNQRGGRRRTHPEQQADAVGYSIVCSTGYSIGRMQSRANSYYSDVRRLRGGPCGRTPSRSVPKRAFSGLSWPSHPILLQSRPSNRTLPSISFPRDEWS